MIENKSVYDTIIELQPFCVECGSCVGLHIHHRVYKSQGGKDVLPNLVRLCWKCHDELHNRNSILADKYRNSYTCSKTGKNVFRKVTKYSEESDLKWFKYLNSNNFTCKCSECTKNTSLRSINSIYGVFPDFE
jgi:hypothetical protein